MDDARLLQAYARQGSDEAFALLVERHGDMVYAACLRQTCDAAMAEDTAQAVFLLLARKAHTLSERTVLSGWLYETARLASANARRIEARRRKHEAAAMQMNAQHKETPRDPRAEWTRLAPHIDEAISALPAADRAALVLRYFEGCTNRELGARLGVSEDAAEKRIARAVERLRDALRRLGVDATAGMLSAALPLAVSAAPAGLLQNLMLIGKAGAVHGTAWATSLKIAKEAANTMFRFPTKFAAIVLSAMLLIGGTGAYLAQAGEPSRTETAPLKPAQPPAETQPAAPKTAPATEADGAQPRQMLFMAECGARCFQPQDKRADRVLFASLPKGETVRTSDPYFDSKRVLGLRAMEMNAKHDLFDRLNSGKQCSAPSAGSSVYLAIETPENCDDMDGRIAAIDLNGRTLTVHLDEFRIPGAAFNHNVEVARFFVLALNNLEAGDYTCRIQRRTFAADGRKWPVRTYPLRQVDHATAAFSVAAEPATKPVAKELAWEKAALPDGAAKTLYQMPDSVPFMLSNAGEPVAGEPRPGLWLGTFDFRAWAAKDGISLSKNYVMLAHAKPGDPPYAFVMGPQINAKEYALLREVRWEGAHATLVITLWRDDGARRENILFFPSLLVPLYPPKLKESITVTVEWDAVRAKLPGRMYQPEGEAEMKRLNGLQNEAQMEVK